MLIYPKGLVCFSRLHAHTPTGRQGGFGRVPVCLLAFMWVGVFAVKAKGVRTGKSR